MTMFVVDAIRLFLFPAMMAFAASSDLLTMTISNRVSVALLAGFFIMAALIGMSGEQVMWHAGTALGVLTVAFVFFACGWIGGGDAKLAAATALWLGPEQMMNYFLYASILGGILTFAMIRFRLIPLPGILVGREWAERLH